MRGNCMRAPDCGGGDFRMLPYRDRRRKAKTKKNKRGGRGCMIRYALFWRSQDVLLFRKSDPMGHGRKDGSSNQNT